MPDIFQPANTALMGPDGAPGQPLFRSLTADDIPFFQPSLDTKFTKGGDTDGAALYIGTNDNFDFTIKTNNNSALTVTKDRNVGIRKSDPQAALHIYGDGSNGSNAYIFFGDSFGNTTTSYVSIGENGGIDSDAMEIFGSQGVYIRTGISGSTAKLFINSSGLIQLGGESPTAKLHLQPCSAGANNSSLKIPAGTLSTASDGAIDYDGTNYYACVSTLRHQLARCLTGSAVLDFPSTSAQSSSQLTMVIAGASPGDCVSLGVPNGATPANSCYTAWVSAASTVTIRFNNYSALAINPISASFNVTVFKNI